jgi:hypothetical protein
VKPSLLVLAGVWLAAYPAAAQSTVTTYTPDLANGGETVLSTSSSSDHTQTQVTQSLNGQQVPLERHESRVISTDANGSVTETIVHRYDPNGQLISTERTVTDQRKTAGGGSTVRSTTYRSDINGSEQPAERSTIETRVSGATTTVDTVVDRPNASGSFQPVEKRVDVTQGTDKKSTTTESIYRADSNDGFREAAHKVINTTQAGGRTVVDTTDYEPGVTNGSLQFQERRVATTTSTPGGNQTTQIDVYAPAAYGQIQSADESPRLLQQQIVTSVKKPDGSVVETLSVRDSSVSDPNRLGDLRQVTQTLCTGKCDGGAPAPAAPAPVTPAPAPGKP